LFCDVLVGWDGHLLINNTPNLTENNQQFCHGVLWPLFHCINTNFFNEGLLESFMEQYEAYAHANQCYLEVRCNFVFVCLYVVMCRLLLSVCCVLN
jgi:hypothetical protein